MGIAATQSRAMRLDYAPGQRFTHGGFLRAVVSPAGTFGSGTFSRRNLFAHGYGYVQQLGFLRSPWGQADDNIFALPFS